MAAGDEAWAEITGAVSDCRSLVGRTRALQVSSEHVRQTTKQLAQTYFRRTRPHFLEIGLGEAEVGGLDADFQELLRLTSGRSLKSLYLRILKRTAKDLVLLNPRYETTFALWARPQPAADQRLTVVEARIISTLEQLVPSAALSYRQAIKDLADPTRLSFRGTANDLRETLRDVLDHLAPDDNVTSAHGYKPEAGQSHPTQKQKTQFIMKSRGLSRGAIDAPANTVVLIEDRVASVTRASSTRSSIATHIATSRSEVAQVKQYVDAVLGELLEIHSV